MDGLGDHWDNFEIYSWAYLHDGTPRQGYSFGYSQHEKSASFSGLKPDQVKKYRMMFTLFHWVEFRDVSLKSKASKTKKLHVVGM